jgi:hypothetical protein
MKDMACTGIFPVFPVLPVVRVSILLGAVNTAWDRGFLRGRSDNTLRTRRQASDTPIVPFADLPAQLTRQNLSDGRC